MKINLKYIQILTFILIILLFIGCSGILKVEPTNIHFAVLGNTYPESPFSNSDPKLIDIINKIYGQNPNFIVHLGDIVYSGQTWMNLPKLEIERQYKDFMQKKSSGYGIWYYTKGNFDANDQTEDLFLKYTGKDNYYSVNFGNLHMVFLDTGHKDKGYIDTLQLEWLKNDLHECSKDYKIFVFTHFPVWISNNNRQTPFLSNSIEIHDILNNNRVQCVFSGHMDEFAQMEMDSIQYFILGTPSLEENSKKNQYYIIEVSNDSLKINDNIYTLKTFK